MAVIFDNAASASGSAVSSLTTPAFMITPAENRAALLGLSTNNGNNITGITASVGGVAGSPVSGADITSSGQRALLFQVTAPPPGSQTATMSWTTTAGSTTATLGVVTASGVDQSAPVNNGASATGFGVTASVAVTSAIGDLTVDTIEAAQSAALTGPTQTQQWNVPSVTNQEGAGSVGRGAGTTTHQWTTLGVTWAAVGANFVQAGRVDIAMAPAVM